MNFLLKQLKTVMDLFIRCEWKEVRKKCRLISLVRDFNTAKLAAYEEYLNDKANDAMRLIPGGTI